MISSIYGLRVLQKGLKIGLSDCIQVSQTSELQGAPPPGPSPGALPLDPTRGHTAGPWTPRQFTLLTIFALTFLAPPLQKMFRGPCLINTFSKIQYFNNFLPQNNFPTHYLSFSPFCTCIWIGNVLSLFTFEDLEFKTLHWPFAFEY